MGAPKFDQDMADRDAQADSANPNELSQRFANQSASGAQTMSVQVLPGLQGGMYMQVQTPNGLMQVQIPRGLQPGMAFHIQVPQPTAVELTGVSLTSRNEGDLERGGGAPAAEGSVVQPQGTPRARPQSASTSREGRNVAAARRRQEAARARANAEEKAAAAAATESDAQEAAAAAEVELTGVSLTSRNEGDLERGGGAPAAEGSVVQPQGTPRARPQSASTSREGRHMAAARRRQEAARARANAVVPPPRPPGYGTEELHSEEEEEEGEARERGERASGAGRSGGLTELRDLADVLSSDEEVEDAKAAEEKATAAAATESDAQEAAAKTASAQQATAQEGTQEALAAKTFP